MNQTDVHCNNPDMQEVAKLAQVLTSFMMRAAQEGNGNTLNWQEACFAAALAMKAMAQMAEEVLGRPHAEVMQDLQETFRHGLEQQVFTKRFANEAAMKAWLAERNVTPAEADDVKNTGYQH